MLNDLSVVIPVLNESHLIKELISRVIANVDNITKNYEVIIVDDGSTDDTWHQIKLFAEQNFRIKAIKFSRNFGHHYAISAGLKNSNGSWVVVMDGDLQDRPEVIPTLYNKAQEGYDVVFVSRINRPENFIYKLLQKSFYFILNNLSGINFESSQANFSIISKKVVDAFNKFPENKRFYGSTIKWLGFKRTSISAEHGVRFAGKSSYTLKKRLNLAGDIIFAFSDKPLRFIVKLGLFFSSISILLFVWIIYLYFTSGFEVQGWTSLISSIFLFGGLILTVIGIIGIYIGRIFNEVKNRPLYITSDELNINKNKED